MFYPPLAMGLFDEIAIRQRKDWRLVGLALGLLTAAQLLIFEEIVVGVAIAVSISLVVASLMWRSQLRTHWKYALKSVAISVLVCVL